MLVGHDLLPSPSESTSRAVRTEQAGQDVPSGEAGARSRRGGMCLQARQELGADGADGPSGACSLTDIDNLYS